MGRSLTPVTDEQKAARRSLAAELSPDAYLAGGLAVALVARHAYPLLAEPCVHPDLAVPVASAEDLLCMKLSAIASRGKARDFWDVHALLGEGIAGGMLSAALDLYRQKFSADDIGHVVRSLAYFGDADAEPLPRELAAPVWEAIKSDFEAWVSALR